jgi:hypothetical protein
VECDLVCMLVFIVECDLVCMLVFIVECDLVCNNSESFFPFQNMHIESVHTEQFSNTVSSSLITNQREKTKWTSK